MRLSISQIKKIIIASLCLFAWQIAYLCSVYYVQFQNYYEVTDGQIGGL